MARRRLAVLVALALSVLVGHAIQDEGTARPVRPGGANFIGAGISCVDGTTRTDCTLVAPAVLAKTTTTLSTCSTASIFDLYRYTIPANTIGTAGILRVRLTGDGVQNQASTTSWTWSIVIGGTTLFADTTALLGQDADRFPIWIDVTLANLGATNSQAITGWLTMGPRSTPTTGIGGVDIPSAFELAGGAIGGTAAEDTTASVDLAIRVTHSVNDAAVCTRRYTALVELL